MDPELHSVVIIMLKYTLQSISVNLCSISDTCIMPYCPCSGFDMTDPYTKM